MNLWNFLFPLRGSISSMDPKGLNLEVTNFGFLKITGFYDGAKVNWSSWVLAKRVFGLAPEEPIETSNLTIIRYDIDPNFLRFFGVLKRERIIFKRSDLETILNEK